MMKDDGSFGLGGKRLVRLGWPRGLCAVLGFCNDTKLNFIMITGLLLSANCRRFELQRTSGC